MSDSHPTTVPLVGTMVSDLDYISILNIDNNGCGDIGVGGYINITTLQSDTRFWLPVVTLNYPNDIFQELTSFTKLYPYPPVLFIDLWPNTLGI